MKTRYTLIALTSLLMLSGCSTPSQLRAQYEVDCTARSKGEQKAFDACYARSKASIRQRMNFVNPLGAAELAKILENLDAQKAAFKPVPKPKPLTGDEYQKLVVAELNKRFDAQQPAYSGQACEVLMSVKADGTIDQIEGTPGLSAAASAAMAQASIDDAMSNVPAPGEPVASGEQTAAQSPSAAATPIAPPKIQEQKNGSLCNAFITTAKANPLPHPPLKDGETSFAVSFTYEDNARPQS